jgi:hypothetical protein
MHKRVLLHGLSQREGMPCIREHTAHGEQEWADNTMDVALSIGQYLLKQLKESAANCAASPRAVMNNKRHYDKHQSIYPWPANFRLR